MQKRYFQSALWYRKNTHPDPIGDVSLVFDRFTHTEIRIFIYKMLDAAYRYDIWNDGPVSVFIQYMETLELALEVTHDLYKQIMDAPTKVSVYLQPVQKVPVTRARIFQFQPIPRMMTLHDLKDPVRLIKQIFRFAELDAWKRILKDRTLLALDITDARSLLYPIDGLLLYNHLSKLVDLMYMIHSQIKESESLKETKEKTAKE